VFLCPAGCRSQERTGESPLKVSELNRVKCRCDLWEEPERLVYDIVAGGVDGIESPYGVMELYTRKEGRKMLMTDSIDVAQGGHSMRFVRNLSYGDKDLLRPIEVTLDISAGSQSAREMSYSEGTLTVQGQDPVEVDFSRGILVYNAMLRLVRLLDTAEPHRYTFDMYAEPFLFRVRKAEEGEG